ncbi:MAG: lysophospholipid acyltransferase family protein [Deltaproteobacteria bacterium]|nr:lysophospholipid acyltransferase family protein [Candidatus Anaeroferrophillus wilburensis]MBN2889757.1 lysophospholipid acyltransferase family protein [Deltaproteobacteria bacterium]
MSDHRLFQPRYWPIWFAVPCILASGLLPLPVLWGLGTALGRLAYHLAGSRRRIARRNIELCFPELSAKEIDQLTKKHFSCLGLGLLTTGMNWGISRRRLKKLVHFYNRSYYDQALAEKRNIILLAPHFLGLELGGLAIGMEREALSLYKKLHNPVVDHLVRRGRTHFGGVLLERNAPLRPLIRLLRQGLPFYYLPDQSPGGQGLFVPFFGIPTATFPMLSRFAQLADAVVIPCFTRFMPYGRGLEIIFGPPLNPFPTGDLLADTTLMNQTIEEGIRLMPEQYFWVHRRFKRRPEGEPPLYDQQLLKRKVKRKKHPRVEAAGSNKKNSAGGKGKVL